MAGPENSKLFKAIYARLDNGTKVEDTEWAQENFLLEVAEKIKTKADTMHIRKRFLCTTHQNRKQDEETEEPPEDEIFRKGTDIIRAKFLKDLGYDKAAEIAALKPKKSTGSKKERIAKPKAETMVPQAGQSRSEPQSRSMAVSRRASLKPADIEVPLAGVSKRAASEPAQRTMASNKRRREGTTQLREPTVTGTDALSFRSQQRRASPDKINATMQEMRSGIGALTVELLDAASVDLNAGAIFVAKPQVPLELLYDAVFGNQQDGSWNARVTQLMRSKKILAADLLNAIVGAGIYQSVFQEEIPWETASQLVNHIGYRRLARIEEVLQLGGVQVSLEATIRQASRNDIESPDFYTACLERIAKDKVASLEFALLDQMDRLQVKPPQHFWQEHTAKLVSIFSKALRLRGELDSAPGNYAFVWVCSGEKLDRNTMREMRTSQGERQVAWSLLPMIQTKSTEAGSWDVVCPAMVISKAIVV